MKHFIIRHKVILFVAALFLITGMLIGSYAFKQTIVAREGTANTPAAMNSVNLMLDYGNGEIRTWNTVSWNEAMSVMNLLENVTGAEHIALHAETDKNGDKYITMINGYPNDQKTKMRWQFWVNNIYEPRVASKYYLRPGDIVLWKYVVEQTK